MYWENCYGQSWFQLSWPFNYYNAGKYLGFDLIIDPDKAENDPTIAVNTALWYSTVNGVAAPAQRSDFAITTRIINGNLECNGVSNYTSQLRRVETYKSIRQCFNLGEPSIYSIW